MDPQFWLECWKLHEIGFHQPRYNALLVEHWPNLTRATPPRQVFVPLCGKTLDMLWLRDQGVGVVGVELSSIAVTDFFQEQAIAFEIDQMAGLLSYHSHGLQLLCGDFFQVQPDHLPEVDAVYDRAALIALPSDLQQRYVDHLRKIAPEHAPILLITLEYDPATMEGPPFSTPEARVRELFERTHEVTRIATRDVLPEHPGLAARGLAMLNESAYAIHPK
ncbi:thiopurine S-methyltransferase [Methyloterricola oryzae]|uniref:thiopurine S-methyltransferase n=1 Tax=Methyloterricola oryzae TaxID=1495050 RepID=UPI0005EB6316|nr:thiopurine S-methyltransferase [Methyloterricola oryzae]